MTDTKSIIECDKEAELVETKFQTEQENFWAGKFGNDYVERNNGPELLACNVDFFSRALRHARDLKAVLEFGANIGMNLKALRLLYPDIKLMGIEINHAVATMLRGEIGASNVFEGSLFDFDPLNSFEMTPNSPVIHTATGSQLPRGGIADLVLIKTVLIHINPDCLDTAYSKLYHSSSRYILVCEYYNTMPVTIEYRGHTNKLFKRDFAGDLLDRYKDLELVDYGFVYHRDKHLIDDISWFLLEKHCR